jgi:NAD+ synthase
MNNDLNIEVVRNVKEWIFNQIKIANADGVVIGVSGGIDSAVAVGLCANVTKVHGLYLPYGYKGVIERDDMQLVCDKFHIPHRTIDISSAVNGFFIPHSPEYDLRLGNIMARTRMIYLYDYAKYNKLLVVNTTNHSEWATGYGTKWGDAVGDIAPLRDFYKDEVRAIAKILGVPQRIIDKAPSAGLWEGQTDEKEMGVTYEVLDNVLRLTDDLQRYINKARELYGVDVVNHIIELNEKTKHKRFPIPNYNYHEEFW